MPNPEVSNERRVSLLRAAEQVLHERGFEHATLLEIAARARLPLDELELIFESKEALAEAIIFEHEQAVLRRLDSWIASHREPRTRLACLVRALEAGNDPTLFGGAHALLCKELAFVTRGNAARDAEERLSTLYVDWTAQQIRALGCARSEARVLAEELVAMLHGAALIAQTLNESALRLELCRIERWLEETVSQFG